MKLAITALAAGGDGLGRDDSGRVTFVPRTVPGDVALVRLGKQTKSFARAELVRVREPGADRVAPACPHFLAGCGGCAWQHVAYPAQLAAKQAIVAGALRRLDVALHPIAAPAPPLGWRRRARFHVLRGQVGLYALGSHTLVPIDHCPQLAPALDAALAGPHPDGELAIALGHRGEVAIGDALVEIEPELWGRASDFAQASAAANAALIACVRGALGPGPGALLELYAGAGNFTRGLVADGWSVTPTDLVAPARPPPGFLAGPALAVIAAQRGPVDAVVLDPPRAGAAEILGELVRLAPRTIGYVSCDPATLARDAEQLVAAGYRATDAWPVDAMPQTAHVEVVMRLTRA